MSNNKFTVDAVPTPRINLAGAFESDLGYYMKNGNKLPPLGKSQLKQLEEQLNDYLKFLNESFILKGFTKGALTVSVINAGLIQDKEGKFIIDLDNSTWVLYDENKQNVLFSYSPKTGLMLSGKLFAEEGTIGGFTISKTGLKAGDATGTNGLEFSTEKDNMFVRLGWLRIIYTNANPIIDAERGTLRFGAEHGFEFWIDESRVARAYLDNIEGTTVYELNGNLDITGDLTVNGQSVGSGGGMSQISYGYTRGTNTRMRGFPSSSDAPITYTIPSLATYVSIFGMGNDTAGDLWYFCRCGEYVGWILASLVDAY